MAVYDYFLTHPFGAGPRSLVVIYTGLTGGGQLNLDGEVTFGSPTDGTVCRFYVDPSGTESLWQLVASNHADDPTNGWKRPLDYADAYNEKVWHRLLSFGAGGGGSGINLVTNEVPVGAINGTNTVFTTARPFSGINIDIFLNGLRQQYAVDYTLPNSTSFNMTTAPIAGDNLVVDYIPL